MRNASRVLLAVIIVFAAIPAFSQQPTTKSNSNLADVSELLMAKSKRFGEYERDFLDYASTLDFDSLERMECRDLVDFASRIGDQLDAANLMVLVYDKVSSARDRARIRLLIETFLNRNISFLDVFMRGVNQSLPRITNQTIAASASRMKDDLRETKALLESIKLP